MALGKIRKKTKQSPVRITCAEKTLRALSLRKSGFTFRQIGEQMGFTEQRAFQLVHNELHRINKERGEEAEEVIRLELERLDEILQPAFKKAQKGDLAAITVVLNIMTRRARLLGLDAPDKREINNKGNITPPVQLNVLFTPKEEPIQKKVEEIKYDATIPTTEAPTFRINGIPSHTDPDSIPTV
jgi:hypothetical protein